MNEKFKLIVLVLFFVLFVVSSVQALDSKKLKAGIPKDVPPFSFFDDDEKVPKGFCVDIIELLGKRLGREIEIYAINESDLLSELDNGRIDFIFGFGNKFLGVENNIETHIIVEKKFFINNSHNDYDDSIPIRRVAIVKDSKIEWPTPMVGDVIFIEAESQTEALAFVNSSKAQSYLSENHMSTNYIIQKQNFKNITEGLVPVEYRPLVFCSREDDSELFFSFTKAYSSIILDKSFEKLYRTWVGQSFRHLVGIYFQYIVWSVAFIVLILFSSLLWNLTLKRKVLHSVKNFQTSEQRYKDLIELSPDMIHLVSRSGKIRFANTISLSKLGKNEGEIASTMFNNLVLPEQKEDVENFIKKIFRDKFSKQEFTFVVKDGKNIQVDTVAILTKVINQKDEVCACLFSRDITERKDLEEKLLYADRLAIIGSMAAGIAHELNNPLGIILTNTEDLIYHEPDKNESDENLRSIERNALRASEIIETLLSYTRPAIIDKAPFNVAQLVDESLLFLKPRIKKRNIKLTKCYPSEPVVFYGDEKMIQQLLINVFLNSIEAIKNYGQISIRINAAVNNGEGRIILEVEDNGKGIPECDIEKIFEAFFTSQKNKGFGLGLFISKIIVERHGGKIDVDSIVGKGTVMKISFPVEMAIIDAFEEY